MLIQSEGEKNFRVEQYRLGRYFEDIVVVLYFNMVIGYNGILHQV